MTFLFGGSKTPSIQTQSIPAVQAESSILADETKKVKQGSPSKGTLLTGPQGLLEPANVSRKVLLGE